MKSVKHLILKISDKSQTFMTSLSKQHQIDDALTSKDTSATSLLVVPPSVISTLIYWVMEAYVSNFVLFWNISAVNNRLRPSVSRTFFSQLERLMLCIVHSTALLALFSFVFSTFLFKIIMLTIQSRITLNIFWSSFFCIHFFLTKLEKIFLKIQSIGSSFWRGC